MRGMLMKGKQGDKGAKLHFSYSGTHVGERMTMHNALNYVKRYGKTISRRGEGSVATFSSTGTRR